jgi:hypothetical protein
MADTLTKSRFGIGTNALRPDGVAKVTGHVALPSPGGRG